VINLYNQYVTRMPVSGMIVTTRVSKKLAW